MSDIAIKFIADQHTAIRVDRIDERSGFFWYLSAIALIALGGFATICWIAFLGWAAGKLFSLW